MGFMKQQSKDKFNNQGSLLFRMPGAYNSETRINWALTYAIAANSNSIDFSDAVATADSFTSYAVRVADNHGNEAQVFISPASPSTTQTANTTALVKTDCWVIEIAVHKGDGGDTQQVAGVGFLELEGAKGSVSGTYSENQAAGTLNVQVYGAEDGVETFARATVADAGTAAFGASALNSEVIATIFMQNTSTQYPLSVYSVALSGDIVTGGKAVRTPFKIAPGEENGVLKVKIDTSTAALQTGTITITNNTTNVSYVVNITTTPA